MIPFADARRMMVDGQIRTSDVMDPRLLAAMLDVPRERFVPPNMAALAYLDRDLPMLGGGPKHPTRYLLKPMVLARLIQAAEIGENDHVLEVGCATGYGSAVLARIARDVVALEEDLELARTAAENVRAFDISNIKVRIGALTAGSASDAPFDAIVINGAIEFVPEALHAQLKDGGRLVCVMRQGPAGKAMLYRSTGGDVSGRSVFDATAPLLPGFARPPAFVF